MSTSTDTIDVVAGIIYNPTKTHLLLALRKPEQHQGNCWEFPGGKIEPGESHADALVRELNEELGITATKSAPYCQIDHQYTDKHVRLHFWRVMRFSGEPIGQENQQLQWFAIEALESLTFPEANESVVARLLSQKNSQ